MLTRLEVALDTEDLEALYQGWQELRLKRAAAAVARGEERRKLSAKAAYVLNAVAAARSFDGVEPQGKEGSALAQVGADPLAEFHARAQADVAQAQRVLGEREQREEVEFEQLEGRVRQAIAARADRHVAGHRPH